MPIKQQIFALCVSILVFIFTIEMVRKKYLKEEYSVLWLSTSFMMIILVAKYNWLVSLTTLIGAGLPTTTLFISSIIFLILIAVQFSIKFSGMSEQIKNLAQDNALLRADMEKIRGERQGEDCNSAHK